MGKLKKEDCKNISIFQLKGWDYFKNGYFTGGNIVWTDSWGNKSRIGFELDLRDQNDMFIELVYKIRSCGDEEWTDIRQKYPITTTPCNYGGERHWFVCSVYKSGHYCGRRVSKLYLGSGSNYFACRHCYDLTYASRIDGYTFTLPDLEEDEKKIKRWYYRGKPTRKHRSYIKKDNAIRRSFLRFALRKGLLK